MLAQHDSEEEEFNNIVQNDAEFKIFKDDKAFIEAFRKLFNNKNGSGRDDFLEYLGSDIGYNEERKLEFLEAYNYEGASSAVLNLKTDLVLTDNLYLNIFRNREFSDAFDFARLFSKSILVGSPNNIAFLIH